MWGNNKLDFVYTTVKNAYNAVPRPHLGYSDHISVMLIPAYRPLLKLAKPVQKLITIWPENATTQITPPPSETPCKPLPPETWTITPPLSKHSPTLPHQRKKLNFFCAIKVCYTQVSGPVQTTCSNTLSSMH